MSQHTLRKRKRTIKQNYQYSIQKIVCSSVRHGCDSLLYYFNITMKCYLAGCSIGSRTSHDRTGDTVSGTLLTLPPWLATFCSYMYTCTRMTWKLHGPTEEIVEISSDDEGVTPTSYGYLTRQMFRTSWGRAFASMCWRMTDCVAAAFGVSPSTVVELHISM